MEQYLEVLDELVVLVVVEVVEVDEGVVDIAVQVMVDLVEKVNDLLLPPTVRQVLHVNTKQVDDNG